MNSLGRTGITLSYPPWQSESFQVFVESDVGFGLLVNVLQNVEVEWLDPLLLKRIYDVRDLGLVGQRQEEFCTLCISRLVCEQRGDGQLWKSPYGTRLIFLVDSCLACWTLGSL